MLKGHTKIELTNVHTGEVETVEKHNMITENLKNICEFARANAYSMDTLNSYLFPVYDKAMGGIILFKDTLDSNSVMMPMPTADAVTGYASNNVNSGDNILRGSRNLTESKTITNGYKYVWDFGTAQANGKISAVALTNAYACDRNTIFEYNTPQIRSLRISLPSQEFLRQIVSFDYDNDILTSINVVDANTINVVKSSIGIHSIKMAGALKYTEISTQTIMSSLSLVTGGEWSEGDDGYYYYLVPLKEDGTAINTQYSTTIFKLARMAKNTLKMDISFGVKDITVQVGKVFMESYASSFAVCNGFLYVGANHTYNFNSAAVTKINYNTGNTEKQFDAADNYSGRIIAINGVIYNGMQAILPDDAVIGRGNSSYTKYFLIGTSASGIPGLWSTGVTYFGKILSDKKGRLFTIHNTEMATGFLYNNLCTINNLETAVTKTADKTMKITYTLTEA